MFAKPWIRIDLRSKSTLPPRDKKVWLCIDGDFQAGYVCGATFRDERQTHVCYGYTVLPIKRHKVWWQEITPPDFDKK